MFQAMTAVNEIELIVGYPIHHLSVAIFPVPCANAPHFAKELLIKRQGIRLATNVDAVADEIATCEIGVGQAPRNRLTAFLHNVFRWSLFRRLPLSGARPHVAPI